jgi:hypothetical protein
VNPGQFNSLIGNHCRRHRFHFKLHDTETERTQYCVLCQVIALHINSAKGRTPHSAATGSQRNPSQAAICGPREMIAIAATIQSRIAP